MSPTIARAISDGGRARSRKTVEQASEEQIQKRPTVRSKQLLALKDPVSADLREAEPRLRGQPGRPRREQSNAARNAILDAALRIFIARGFSSASMTRIAFEAGVTRLTLYRHFETRDVLFAEVARRAQLSVRERLGTMVNRGQRLETVLREIIQKLYDGYTHPEYLAVMRMVISEAEHFPELGRAMLDDSSHVTSPLVEYLQQLKEAGLIEIESPRDAATQIAGLACGAGRYVLISPPRDAARRRHAVESLVELFTRAWRVAPAKK